MSTPVLAFFNNKTGVGNTSLVYHVAWMMARKNLNVVVADLDPQANLTASFLDEDTMESVFVPPMIPAHQRIVIRYTVA